MHGAGGLDELSAQRSEANNVADPRRRRGDACAARRVDAEINPDIRGGSAAENAEEMRALLNGGGRPGHRDAVILNAAGALVVAGKAKDVPEGLADGARNRSTAARRAGRWSGLIAVSQSAP